MRRREFRLVPLVVLAAGCLFTLKVIGLVADGGYVLSGARVARAQAGAGPNTPSWAHQMFNYPDNSTNSAPAAVAGGAEAPPPPGGPKQPEAGSRSGGSGGADGGVGASGGRDAPGAAKDAKPAPAAAKAEKPADKGEKTAAKPAGGAGDKAAEKMPDLPANAVSTKIDLDRPQASPGERALLERLQERRQELESRGRDLDLREGLLKAAEKRLESRIGELKEIEARINGGAEKRAEAETTRLKGVITMYENMKPKEAARIFDRLDLKILYDVARQMNPRRMSDILAQMNPEAAERLTVELANRSGGAATAELPKIEGRPTNN